MRVNSLALRLFVSATAWAVVILVITGIVLSSIYRQAEERAFDRRLGVYLRTLVADVASPEEGGEKFPHLSASQLYGQLLGYACSKGIKPGFAFWKFVELRGNEPSAMTKRAPATTPSPEVAAWLKHKFIAEIKAREKARREEAGA